MLLAEQYSHTTTLEHIQPRHIPWVFHRQGAQMKGFRKAWASTCARAVAPPLLFHDFRRTAVRNMVRAGIAERVAMPISEHKIRFIFDRYHIVSASALKEAAHKLSGLMGTILRTMAPDRGLRKERGEDGKFG